MKRRTANLRLYFHPSQVTRGTVIDRRTIYGNPFRIGPDGSRDSVIRKHDDYFLNRLKEDVVFREAVEKLRVETVLLCWCAPLPCHGDNIIRYLEETDNNRVQKNER